MSADVRMTQRRQQASLALETREAFAIGGEGCREHLDRHIPAECVIVRAIDFSHAARAQSRADLIGADSPADAVA
jgi:hypothetical protein